MNDLIDIDYTNESKTTTISSRCIAAAAAVSVLCEAREQHEVLQYSTPFYIYLFQTDLD